MRDMIANYNAEVERWRASGGSGDPAKFVNASGNFVKWTGPLIADVGRNRDATFDVASVRTAMYRPFTKEAVYFDPQFNHRQGQLREVYPTSVSENHGIYLTAPGGGHDTAALMIDVLPDLAFWGSGSGQYFPRYSYRESKSAPGALDVFDDGDEPRFERIDNITDEILTDYRQSFGRGISKDDIFFYVYGLLHSREYRAEFEADLKKMLPRIPKVMAFKEFVEAGRALSELHLNYETVEPYPLIENVAPNASLRVTKMRYAKEGRQDNKTTIIYNDGITLTDIPEEAQEYLLGSRSALDWIIERYQVKTDKASGIVNDPNAWGDEHGDPRYILDLLKRITTVSVETVKIVNGLPSLEVVGA